MTIITASMHATTTAPSGVRFDFSPTDCLDFLDGFYTSFHCLLSYVEMCTDAESQSRCTTIQSLPDGNTTLRKGRCTSQVVSNVPLKNRMY